jgi:glycosyltransferase involved in cell wall biosynthesis
MIVANLATSGGFGGPEWQMLGLATALPDAYRSRFLLFPERGKSRPFWEELRRHGVEAAILESNWPRLRATVREVASRLRSAGADVLCCHGYKADIIGYLAARRVGIPSVSVSHGWTGASPRVKVYEAADRRVIRWMDRVVAVSEGQAAKVRRAGVRPERVAVIHNAVHAGRFDAVDPAGRDALHALFPRAPGLVVGAIGRLSPEKGFDQLILAARTLADARPDVGFVLFGEGPLREALRGQVVRAGLEGRFVLAGHRADIDRFLPHLDVLAMSSHTEGLPCVLLEAMAAGVPVVATAVGGIPEAVADGASGFLVPPGDPAALADRIGRLLADEGLRRGVAGRARGRVREGFTFAAQAEAYARLFAAIVGARAGSRAGLAG